MARQPLAESETIAPTPTPRPRRGSLLDVEAAERARRTLDLPPAPAPAPPPTIDRLLPPALRGAALVGFDAISSVSDEPIDYVWHGLLARDHLAEVTGASGSGKTTLAFLVGAAAAAIGEPVDVLGRRVTPIAAGRYVVIIEEENGKRSCRDKLLASCEMLGLDPRTTLDRVLLLARAGFRASEHEAWNGLLDLGRKGRIGLVILDSRARIFAGGDANDENSQAAVAAMIAGLIKASGAPVIVVSHTRKGAADSLDDVSGSHQRVAAADVVLLVNAKKSDGRVLSSRVVVAKLRDAVDEHPEPVTFAISKEKAGRWRCAVSTAASVDDANAHDRVHALLEQRGELTKNEIREALTMSGASVEAALTTLFGEKRIKRTKRDRRGREVDVFSAKSDVRELDQWFDGAKPSAKPKAKPTKGNDDA